MKQIVIKKIIIDNFKGIKHQEIEFDENRTTIKGQNGTGKTSVYDSLLWVLFGKNHYGNSATDIRPHDENGDVIHNIEISVSATLCVDGVDYTLGKQNVEKWTTKRGSKEKVLSGNTNNYTVNDIPKSEKDFKDFVNTEICDEELFLSCTNAQSFFKLDTKKRRAKLLDIISDFSDDAVIDSNDAFKELLADLKVGTLEELLTRSKRTLKNINEEMEAIPIRISEQEESKVDIDTAELELQKNMLQSKLDEIDNKLSLEDESDKEIDELKQSVSKIQSQIGEYVQRMKSDYLTQEKEYLDKSTALEIDIKQVYFGINSCDSEIFDLNKDIERKQITLDEIGKQYHAEQEKEFDINSLKCQYCGQEYPPEKKEKIQSDFASHKASECKRLIAEGKGLKSEIESMKETLQLKVDKKSELIKKQSELSAQKDKLKKPTTISDEVIFGADEYKSLLNQMTKLESEIKEKAATIDRHALISERSEIFDKLTETTSQISRSERNVEIDERIEELETRQRELAQLSADEQRKLDIMSDFNIKRMTMLTDAINKHFSLIKFQMFSSQLNGGYQDVCIATVGGSSYDGALNHGHKILAEIDLLETFQRLNDISIPIFSDDTESVDSWRLPQVDGQVIYLQRTDDKELIVEGM